MEAILESPEQLRAIILRSGERLQIWLVVIGNKLELYRQNAVRFTLLGDPQSTTVECYRLVDGVYQLQTVQDRCCIQLSDAVSLDVDFSWLRKLNGI